MQAYDRKNDMAMVTRRRMKPSFLIWQKANLEDYRDMAARTWKKEWEEGLRWKNMVVVGGELLSLSSIAKGRTKRA